MKYDDINKLSVSQIEDAVSAEPDDSAADGLGKIVGSYRWYVIGTADKEYADKFKDRKRIKVNFPENGIRDVDMGVESVKKDGDKIIIILSCNLMSEVYANMRKGSVEVVSSSGSGYKVPVQAVRFDEDNNPGIYVLRGKIINFIKVETLYSDGQYAIVDSLEESSDKISLYDDVIIKGKDLADGNVIR